MESFRLETIGALHPVATQLFVPSLAPTSGRFYSYGATWIAAVLFGAAGSVRHRIRVASDSRHWTRSGVLLLAEVSAVNELRKNLQPESEGRSLRQHVGAIQTPPQPRIDSCLGHAREVARLPSQ